MAGKLPVKDARTWKMTAVIRTQESANRVTNSKTYCWKRAKRNSLLYLSIIRLEAASNLGCSLLLSKSKQTMHSE